MYCAVTSEFEARLVGDGAAPKEFAKRLTITLVDRVADRLFGVAIDRTQTDFIKDRLSFGKNPQVYHTVYFAQPPEPDLSRSAAFEPLGGGPEVAFDLGRSGRPTRGRGSDRDSHLPHLRRGARDTAPPAAAIDEPIAAVHFTVRPTDPGEGELSMTARQGQVPLVILKLHVRITELQPETSTPVSVRASTDEPAEPAAPICQLRIFDRSNGEHISYEYDLDIPGVVFNHFESPSIQGTPIQYVNSL